jgi:hypothetical protein
MKTVFNNRELCHVFASQSQDEGRGSHMSFRGGVLRSYSTAIYRIASFKGKQYLIENSNNFSNATGKHKNYAWRALHHIEPCFSVDRGRGTDLDLSPKDIVREYEERAKEAAKETHKLRRKKYEIYMESARWWKEAVRAAEFFRMGTYGRRQGAAMMERLAEPFKEDYEKFHAASEERRERAAATRSRNEQIRRAEEIAQQQAMVDAFLADHTTKELPARWLVPDEKMEAYEARLKKREEWKLEQKKELMEAWMKGDSVDTWELRDLPVRLRVKPIYAPEPTASHAQRNIETSHGAVIPYEDGRRAYAFCRRLWNHGKEWRRNGEQFKVGHYHLDSVTGEGLVAGCHRISKETIEAFALQQEWHVPQSTEAEAAQ